jgi:RNA polymerase sigma-70 factor (ECF subfamily)
VAERTDADAIEASTRDPAAFGVVFDRHGTTMHRYLVRRVGANDADGLLGELFRIAFERRTTYDTARANARPWLYGIATNLVARHRRSEARRFRAETRLRARPAEHTADEDRIVDAVAATVLLPHVVDAIAALPDGERDALLLHAWEDLGYEEIARALEIPVGTVRSRLNRARRRLRELPAVSGEHLTHPDVFTRQKETLMSSIAGSQPHPEVLAHRSRMYPRLAYRDVSAALEFLTRAFGFTERREARIEEDGRPSLVWLEFGAGLVMLSTPNADVHQIASPHDVGGTTTMINVEVDDVDAHHARAVAEGAVITTGPDDMYYGARRYEATDLEGHRWHFESPLPH